MDKKTNYILLLSWLAVIFLLFLMAAPVELAAQEVETRRSSIIDEVIVTAQKREENIKDVPITMQAFTGNTLRKIGIVDTRDLASIVPGFSYSPSGKDTPVYTMRGVGFNDLSRTANAAVGVYVDEVPIPYPYMTQGANIDLRRVEVLKGPQGTLYGRNTTGGAINYIANKPTESLEYGIEAEYGRFERHSIEGYISGPLTKSVRGRLALRDIQAEEGWQNSLTRPEDRLGKEDKQVARGIIEWDVVDFLRLNLSVDWWKDRSEPLAPQAIALNAQNQSLSEDELHPDVRNHPLVEKDDPRLADWRPEVPWTVDNEYFMPSLRAYWDVTDKLLITLIAAYSEFETGEGKYPLDGLSISNMDTIRQSTDTKARSLELRAEGYLFSDRITWLLGLFDSEDKVKDDMLQQFDTASGAFNIVPGVIPFSNRTRWIGEQNAKSRAVFGNLDYLATNYLEFSFGIRYTEEERDYAGCVLALSDEEREGVGFAPIFNSRSLSEGGSGGAGPGDCLTLDEETRNPSLIRKELDEDNIGGKISISWKPTTDFHLYGSFSRGFKSGSFPITSASEGEQYDPVTQERVDSVEVGVKTSWFNQTLGVNISAFQYDYKDKQLFSLFVDPVFGLLPKLFNVPKSSIKGAELEIQSNPLNGLDIVIAASYLDTEIDEFVGITSEGETIDFSGRDLPFAPDKEVSVLVNYTFNLPYVSNLEGSFGVDYTYIGKATTAIEPNPLFQVSSYELINARFGIGDVNGHWDVTAWVRNVMSEFYQINALQFSNDTIVRYTGKPHTAGVTITYRYF